MEGRFQWLLWVMLLSSLKPEAGARDATHSHQDENKQEKPLAGLELERNCQEVLGGNQVQKLERSGRVGGVGKGP